MTDPEATAPPVKRKWWQEAQAWCEQHPDWLLMFVFGFILGAIIL